MNRNKRINKNLKELSDLFNSLDNDDICKLFFELFTEAELDDLSKRWRILKLLKEGYTQRVIAKELKVSLCKVTRGAKILKDKKAVVTKFLETNG